MRWLTFFIFAYLMLVVEVGLRTLWSLPIGGGVAPSLTLVLLVFVTLSARPVHAAWAAIILGVLVDLAPVAVTPQGLDVLIVGPTSMGYLIGVAVTLRLRGVLFRQSPIALGIASLVLGAIALLMFVTLMSLRGVFTLGPLAGGPLGEPIPGWRASAQLIHGFVQVIYTALIALPVGYLLLKTDPWWRFGPTKSGSGSGRLSFG